MQAYGHEGKKGGEGDERTASGNSIDAAGKKCRDGEEDDAAGAQIVHGS